MLFWIANLGNSASNVVFTSSLPQGSLGCVRGDTKEWNLTVSKLGKTIDLTGSKIWMTARRTRGGSIVFQKTSDPSMGITIDPNQTLSRGKAVIKLESSDTSGLSAETVALFYDVQVRTATDLFTVGMGDLLITPDSTLETA